MKYFGTDGFRGRANEGLNVEHAFKIGRFVGWYYGAREGRKARVVLGKDTRRSSYMFESALVAGLVASGADAYLLHVIPTPGVCYEVVDGQFDCGIMVSASHNPYTDNGIKLVDSGGAKMDEDVLLQIEDFIDGKVEVPLATGESIGCTFDYMQGRNRYIAHLIASANFSLQGVRVGLDCANGAASSVAKPVFDALGADVYVINNAPTGLNINVDCGSTHIQGLQHYVVRNNLDVGFAYDGDADRCIAVDENGHVVDGDLIMYVCGTYLSKYGRLSEDTVVPTVMSNYGLFRAFDEAGLRYETTQVGDRFVYACMREHGYSLGGEQSGHIIFGDLETTGDGIMTSLRVMEAVRAERESLATLARPVTLYPQRLENVRVKDREAAMAAPELAEATKRAEALLAGNGRVLVRPSGTEPLVRILAEAPDEELCRKATSVVAEALAPYREEDAES
ncbi:MAG: phosphoglucosamine mutase [Atopobiaceae bacterium]|jgi:phosphoglucosamine mutase|nr:phosphoglucosamine mutase [Atopobiaceae bacterium]MCH4120415.1 phosphoglucosamine mutase [Atopobiaceae bacterium]MCI1389693.1 phosphoglucosamine mutase [Atopobiaceae bacterium]MCI1431905.1 phosphoglucosamine mutase [Atopobiaceae bacterium]MCI1470341.1 phosphoglucosamine mutase [Atopobiaceae bacterium]